MLSTPTAPFCLKLYGEVLQLPSGALLWSFLKPVLHGKVLYTPDTPETRMVIQKVSSGARPPERHTRRTSFRRLDVARTRTAFHGAFLPAAVRSGLGFAERGFVASFSWGTLGTGGAFWRPAP